MKKRLAAHLVVFLATFGLLASAALLAAGRPSLNVYFQTTLKDAAYQKKVFQKVASTWASPEAASFPKVGKKAVVQAVIGKDGRIVSAFVSTESGSKAWDKAALAGVEAAAPFEKLPAGFGHQTLEAHFHFSVVP
jgi:protein TonB